MSNIEEIKNIFLEIIKYTYKDIIIINSKIKLILDDNIILYVKMLNIENIEEITTYYDIELDKEYEKYKINSNDYNYVLIFKSCDMCCYDDSVFDSYFYVDNKYYKSSLNYDDYFNNDDKAYNFIEKCYYNIYPDGKFLNWCH